MKRSYSRVLEIIALGYYVMLSDDAKMAKATDCNGDIFARIRRDTLEEMVVAGLLRRRFIDATSLCVFGKSGVWGGVK